MTIIQSLQRLYIKDSISAEWRARVDLVACCRVAAAYAPDDLTARAVAFGEPGSKQVMGGARAVSALLRKLDHENASYRE